MAFRHVACTYMYFQPHICRPALSAPTANFQQAVVPWGHEQTARYGGQMFNPGHAHLPVSGPYFQITMHWLDFKLHFKMRGMCLIFPFTLCSGLAVARSTNRCICSFKCALTSFFNFSEEWDLPV